MYLVQTKCFLSSNQRKSDMKSKWWVYDRIASGFRGSHNFSGVNTRPQSQMRETNLYDTVVVSACEEVRLETLHAVDSYACKYCPSQRVFFSNRLIELTREPLYGYPLLRHELCRLYYTYLSTTFQCIIISFVLTISPYSSQQPIASIHPRS